MTLIFRDLTDISRNRGYKFIRIFMGINFMIGIYLDISLYQFFGAHAKTSPKELEGLENLAEKLLDMATRMRMKKRSWR